MDLPPPACSSLIFQLNNDSPIFDILNAIADAHFRFFSHFLFYVGPILFLANIAAIFILTRRELRTPYNIIFIVMALDYSLVILGQHIPLWKSFLRFGCRTADSYAYRLFEMTIENLCPMFSAHAIWLAVIITFVRLRHTSSSIHEPSLRYITAMCSLSFVIVFLVGMLQFLSYDFYWDTTTVKCESDQKMFQRSGITYSESNRLYENNCLLMRIIYISNGVLYNTLPCALLLALSAALTYRLSQIRKIHTDRVSGGSSAMNAESVRSSWMIAMIVFTTLITGVPQAILNILVGSLSNTDGDLFSTSLTALVAILVIISSAINLAIYLCMSKRIRKVTMSYLCCVCRRVNSRASSRVVSSPNHSKICNNRTVSVMVQ